MIHISKIAVYLQQSSPLSYIRMGKLTASSGWKIHTRDRVLGGMRQEEN